MKKIVIQEENNENNGGFLAFIVLSSVLMIVLVAMFCGSLYLTRSMIDAAPTKIITITPVSFIESTHERILEYVVDNTSTIYPIANIYSNYINNTQSIMIVAKIKTAIVDHKQISVTTKKLYIDTDAAIIDVEILNP